MLWFRCMQHQAFIMHYKVLDIFYFDQVVNLTYHSEDLWRCFHFHCCVQFFQTQGNHGFLLALRPVDDTFYLGYFNFFHDTMIDVCCLFNDPR